MRTVNMGESDCISPWPGLPAYEEKDYKSFVGRETEQETLLRALRRETLTVLYGQSGLGKTSLIQAGLFPRLRKAGGFPVRIRLTFESNAPSLTRQVLDKITQSAKTASELYSETPEFQITVPTLPSEKKAPGLTLWEYFHARDQYFWTASSRLATPILVFDQFEEWFTRGQALQEPRQTFLTQIHQLLDNDPPKNHESVDKWNFERVPFVIVLSLREDYLAHLNSLRDFLPGLGACAFRLLPFTEGQAREVIEKPAPTSWQPPDKDFTDSVLELLQSTGRRSSTLPPSLSGDTDYDPAILSLLLNRLFGSLSQTKSAEERARIVRRQGHDVLLDFYLEAVRQTGVSNREREFLEENLVTRGGFRNSIALEDATERYGVRREVLERLRNEYRLLHFDDRTLHHERVELAHDVVCAVVINAGNQRRAARRRRRWKQTAFGVSVVIIGCLYFVWRFTRDDSVMYADSEEHFKYGSIGGEREAGIPYWIWKVLPEVFPEYLPDKTYRPGQEYVSLGFLYEAGKDLPIGVSRRNTQGIDRVFLNCAACHTGSVREAPGKPRVIYAGMPSNTINLEAFAHFIFNCASDPAERFNARLLMPHMEKIGGKYDPINRFLMRYYVIPLMRQRLLTLRHLFRFADWEPDAGPGRADTSNSVKTLLGFPLEELETRQLVGLCDFPSIWLQGLRKEKNIDANWDGNNSMTEERNRSAAFGTGTFPPTIDLKQLQRIEDWLSTKEPPKYPFPIKQEFLKQGEALYGAYCANCHGRNGRDFSGEYVGKVTPIELIKTDRHRLDSFTSELAIAQSTLYAGYLSRFSHFRKTSGYANPPLDGIWLRAPYLHNGSVPTLRDLLNPAAERPPVFYRGYDVFDQQKVGFVSELAMFTPEGRSISEPNDMQHYFRLDTQEKPGGVTPRVRNEGNGNAGHEGEAYGTMLSAADKDALVEYLKTF